MGDNQAVSQKRKENNYVKRKRTVLAVKSPGFSVGRDIDRVSDSGERTEHLWTLVFFTTNVLQCNLFFQVFQTLTFCYLWFINNEH